ncbi:hypothetical protein M406DRAFT_349555 [Cryphonectria parasitica EP155]|uniref:Uncharacterized protein n=1 Tax=Cryphonectria parasitica (strain ATCC 38755 / EP155) TaxID=660469 RepID=A0A9P5CU81_CRYP1|nr:uncharacterized protein M406DRAFT_349555 [Cryphonectria parasitica EP155]KAF3771123.1 hypothetical protein M406DRAFT_349555 [Cryphonectria parasitica EP155]
MSTQRQITPPPPVLTQTLPRLLVPLVALLLSTFAAFIIAISANLTNLISLWTQCSSSPAPSSSWLALAGSTQAALRELLCFGVLFFQTALDSTLARLEMACIVAFLAALATVTAIEAARARADEEREQRQRASDSGKEKPVMMAAEDDDNNNNNNRGGHDQHHHRHHHLWSLRAVRNLTVPWLLYNLVLGAIAWQTIIIPAFITRQSSSASTTSRRRNTLGQRLLPNRAAGTRRSLGLGPGRPRLAIAAGTLFGVLAPGALLLLQPHAPSPTVILVWLLFPVCASLVRYLVRLPIVAGHHHHHHQQQSSSTRTTSSSPSMALAYAIPILCSAASHALLLTHLFLLLRTTTTAAAAATTATDDHSSSSPTRSALVLLEVDHTALLLTFLYWVYAEAGGRAVYLAIASSLLLGPGAGVCLGWLYRDHVHAKLKEEEEEVNESGRRDGGDASSKASPRPRRRATTGHFFDGPLA